VKVLLLSRYGRLGASSRLRSYQYIPHLLAAGIEVTVTPLLRDEYLRRLYAGESPDRMQWFTDYLGRFLNLLKARRFDLLWIEKELFPNMPAWFEQGLSLLGVPYIVDFDDAIFHRYELSSNPLKRCLARKIDEVMRAATLVVCGNQYLANRARSVNAKRVEIVPTVIDTDKYRPKDHALRDGVTIGWIGTPQTVHYLKPLVPVFRTLALELDVRVRVIGATFTAPDVQIESRPWTESTEVSEIRDFDIGVMPLLDSPWERGKCGYKLIQYMGCGLPVVASPVGVNGEIVAPSVNGYLAASEDEWHSTLRRLCVSRANREQLGLRGRSDVERKYSLNVTAPRLADILKEAVRRT
jgi:glycosyltransferase involved in cell wall biosynthesis